MAEIKIEKKKPVWPWVLVVLIILAAIYFFWYYNDGNINDTQDIIPIQDSISRYDETFGNQGSDTLNLYNRNYGTVRGEQALAEYFSFVDNKDNRTADHGYYRNGFFTLIAATKRQSEMKSVEVSQNVESAMDHAENLTNGQATTAKANHAKQAADEIAKALKTIQQKEYDNLSNEADDLNKAVANIDGSQNLDQQSSNLNTFFDMAARLLQKMNDSELNR